MSLSTTMHHVLLVLLAVGCASAGTTAPAQPAPLPPEVAPDGRYVDPDAKFAIQLPPGTQFQHTSNSMLGLDGVVADADKGVIMVLYWKPPVATTVKDLDDYLASCAKTAVPADIHVEGASLARAITYTVHAPQPDAVGEAWAMVRGPWMIIVLVHAWTGTPFERTYRRVLGSFALRPL